MLKPGDRILGMNLAHGGHLTHGSPVNFSGKLFEVHAYGVREETERIDYDALERQAREVRPKVIVAGASAYPRIIDFERWPRSPTTSTRCCSSTWPTSPASSRRASIPSPFPHADLVTTTTHKTLRGPRGGLVFAARTCRTGSTGPTSRSARAPSRRRSTRRVFPGIQGGPLMHVIAAKAVALKLAATDEFRTTSERTIENAAGARRRRSPSAARGSSRAARTTT